MTLALLVACTGRALAGVWPMCACGVVSACVSEGWARCLLLQPMEDLIVRPVRLLPAAEEVARPAGAVRARLLLRRRVLLVPVAPYARVGGHPTHEEDGTSSELERVAETT